MSREEGSVFSGEVFVVPYSTDDLTKRNRINHGVAEHHHRRDAVHRSDPASSPNASRLGAAARSYARSRAIGPTSELPVPTRTQQPGPFCRSVEDEIAQGSGEHSLLVRNPLSTKIVQSVCWCVWPVFSASSAVKIARAA